MGIRLVLVLGFLMLPLRGFSAEKEALKPPVLIPFCVPIGSLGHPVGDYLTIEGVRVNEGKVGVHTFRVDTVNGKALDQSVDIWVDNLALPAEGHCVLKGYETFSMIGVAPAVVDAAREEGRDLEMPQAGWQLKLRFIALRVIRPAGLKPEEFK
jgi:hypothetical protein